jgi:hypothetical protein
MAHDAPVCRVYEAELDEGGAECAGGVGVSEECRWLPMDSAPKDGTMILGWVKEWYGERPYIFWYQYGGWEWDKDDTVLVPSWWMPLPGPPCT